MVWPTLISVSVTPGPYFFSARARSFGASVAASVASEASAIVRRETFGMMSSLCFPTSSAGPSAPADLVLGPLVGAHETKQITGHLAHLDLFRALGDPVAAVMAVDVFERLMARI